MGGGCVRSVQFFPTYIYTRICVFYAYIYTQLFIYLFFYFYINNWTHWTHFII
nr:MAG TPA: hypothetical protein [Bacteriophage sp.]